MSPNALSLLSFGQPRTDAETHDKLSASRLAQHDYHHATGDNEIIVVRVEVTDTGCGIEESELAGSKLFSAFNQTERGEQQGGKGTGLGLALVRNIVKLSGGRLGVKSQSNKGSTFWGELPLGVGRKALIPSPGINIVSRVESQGSGSDGSMGSDVAKVRAAAAVRESQIIGMVRKQGMPFWRFMPGSASFKNEPLISESGRCRGFESIRYVFSEELGLDA